MSLLYSHNVTFPHYTKSTAAGSSQIEFPSRSVEGQELLFLIRNASGDVVTYQLKEQLGHQVAPLLQTTCPKTQKTSRQSTRQATCLQPSSFLCLLFSSLHYLYTFSTFNLRFLYISNFLYVKLLENIVSIKS